MVIQYARQWTVSELIVNFEEIDFDIDHPRLEFTCHSLESTEPPFSTQPKITRGTRTRGELQQQLQIKNIDFKSSNQRLI